MGIFSGFRRKVANVHFGIFGVTSTYKSGQPEEVADVFTCVKILSENISKMTPSVRDKTNKIAKHQLNDILGWRPNLFQNHQAFWQTVEYKRNIYGNAYVYVERNGAGQPVKLYSLSNESILQASINEYGRLFYDIDFGLTIATPFTDARTVSSFDVLHFKHQSKDGIFGISPLVSLASYAAILSNASQMLSDFYANSAMSTLALKPRVDRASLATSTSDAAEAFTEKYGKGQSGKILAIPPNMDLVEVNQKYSDAQLIETQRYSKEQIGNMFGIPKFMLGITDTDKSIEQQTKQFLALSLSPILAMYAAEMEFKLVTTNEHNRGLYIGYNTEKMIETDTKTRAEVISMLVSKGIMTPNEGALAMGNEPIDSIWGDMHYTQSQNIPYEQYDQFAKKNGTEPLGETEKKPINDKTNEKDSSV
jgi:HK97 family phage portal protein